MLVVQCWKQILCNIKKKHRKTESCSGKKVLYGKCLKNTCADLSTWENCSPWDFDHNSIQNTIILGDAVENCYLPHNLLKDWLSKSNIATEVVLPWIYSAITKIKHLADSCSKIFTLHSFLFFFCLVLWIKLLLFQWISDFLLCD